MSDQEWRRKAACVGVPDEVMFPKGDGGGAARRVDQYGPARAVCRPCPVRDACLEAALAEEQRYAGRHGMRGGLDPDQRARKRTRRTA